MAKRQRSEAEQYEHEHRLRRRYIVAGFALTALGLAMGVLGILVPSWRVLGQLASIPVLLGFLGVSLSFSIGLGRRRVRPEEIDEASIKRYQR